MITINYLNGTYTTLSGGPEEEDKMYNNMIDAMQQGIKIFTASYRNLSVTINLTLITNFQKTQ